MKSRTVWANAHLKRSEERTMAKPAIGFIGLGFMGSAMVERLQAQGYAVTVVANQSRENVEAAVARGATEAATAKAVAAAGR